MFLFYLEQYISLLRLRSSPAKLVLNMPFSKLNLKSDLHLTKFLQYRYADNRIIIMAHPNDVTSRLPWL